MRLERYWERRRSAWVGDINTREAGAEYLGGATRVVDRATQAPGWASERQMCGDPSTRVMRPECSCVVTQDAGGPSRVLLCGHPGDLVDDPER